MEVARVKLELYTMTNYAAVSACEMGSWEFHQQLLVQTATAHVNLDSITYNAAVIPFQKDGRWFQALRLSVWMT